MKKILIFLGLYLISGCLFARNFDQSRHEYFDKIEAKQKAWKEEKEIPSALPDMQDPSWYTFNIDDNIENTTMLLLSSVHNVSDNTTRYILNIRSKHGLDNISLEGLYCKDEKYRTIAYADTINNRWIETKGVNWQEIGSSTYEQNQIHRFLKQVLCQVGATNSEENIKKRIKIVLKR